MSAPHETPTEKARRCTAILGELTEMGLTLARDLHARALAAETGAEAQALGLAFQRVSRSVRQSLALEIKLERELQQEIQKAESQAQISRVARRCEHKTKVVISLQRLLWTEAERNADDDDDESEWDEDSNPLLDDLMLRLDEAALAEDFLDTPVEALVARFTADMGLAPAAPPNSS